MAMSDAEFEDLKETCRQERQRGLDRHHAYILPRHTALHRRYLIEKQRRDIEAIDAAFERASQRILEAAE